MSGTDRVSRGSSMRLKPELSKSWSAKIARKSSSQSRKHGRYVAEPVVSNRFRDAEEPKPPGGRGENLAMALGPRTPGIL